jgi:drug/metabolite transporter (DMT)-like permease
MVFSSRQKLAGVMFALVAAIGFSAKAVLVKLAYIEEVDPITLLALRMAFSLPFFLLAAWVANRHQSHAPMTRSDWWAVTVFGFTGYYLASFLDFLGLQYISAGLERLILFLYPTMVVLISAVWFRQLIGRRVIVALVLSYLGIAFAYVHDMQIQAEGVLLGAGLVFASALAYAIYLIGAGHTIARIGATRFTAYAMTVACLAALLQFVLMNPISNLDQPIQVYSLSLGMALFSTVMPAFILAAAIRRIGSMRTSIIGSVGPVSTIYLAYAFLGEAVSLMQILGSLLVLAGVLMIGLKKTEVQPD